MINKNQIEELISFSKTIKVLYVEDNEESRISTLLMLENLFNNITIAVDGVDGYNKFQEGNFDLIISDINMPNMNGVEMLKKIRAANSQISFIILSAHNEMEYFLDTIRLGVDGYIIKPIVLNQLVDTLTKVLYKIKLEQENKEYKKSLLTQIKLQQDTIVSQGKFAAMGEMIGMIAHQWRQPLNVIILNITSIKMMVHQKKIKKLELDRIIESITDTVNYMNQTIEDFRNFLTINNKPSSVQIADLAYKPKHLIEAQMEALGVSFRFQSDIDTSKTIFIDSSKFYQVVLNLYKNSIDEFKSKDTLNPCIKVNIFEHNNKIIMTVEDNAGGIPEDIILDIFNPYFSTKGKNGTGIGLYMSKKIIQDHIKGNIWVKNTENGAIFTIEIPKEEEEVFQRAYKCLVWDQDKEIFIRDQQCSNKELLKESAEIIKILDNFFISYEVLDNGDIKVFIS